MTNTKDNPLTKLMIIQASLKAPKDQKNNFGGYSYRSLEGILEALKPLLYTTKTTLSISDDVVQVGDRIYFKATATLKDAETWEVIESTTALAREDESQKGMMSSQLSGSTSSYARKYCVCWLFSIDNGEGDPDSINTHWKEEKVVKKAEPKKEEKTVEDNPNGWFKRAIENTKFMKECMDENDYIRKIANKYTLDETIESQLRQAYKNATGKNEPISDLPFN